MSGRAVMGIWRKEKQQKGQEAREWVGAKERTMVARGVECGEVVSWSKSNKGVVKTRTVTSNNQRMAKDSHKRKVEDPEANPTQQSFIGKHEITTKLEGGGSNGGRRSWGG